MRYGGAEEIETSQKLKQLANGLSRSARGLRTGRKIPPDVGGYYTLGDKLDASTCYFHAHYRRENPTTLRKDFEILPRIKGRGRFLGCSLGVIADTEKYGKSWWGEGEVKMYIDGDTDHPTISGTGTEDYIATGWGQGQYSHLWHGCPFADGEGYRYGFYRLHGRTRFILRRTSA